MDQIIAKLRRGWLVVWLPAMLIVAAASIVARRSASMSFPGSSVFAGDSVFGLAYGFGASAYSLVKLHRFGMFVPEHGWWSVALRMPFIPLFLAGLSQISTNLTFQFLVKILIFYSLVVAALGRLGMEYGISRLRQLAIVLALFLIPFNILTGCRLEVEEGYLFPLMLAVYVLLLVEKKAADYVWCGLATAAIYLIKSSMGPFCLVVALWAVFSQLWRDRRVRLRAFVPLIALVVAMVAWGGYVKARTGRFAIGADGSSWNGENLYKANNPLVLQYYPYVTLDNLGYLGLLPIPITPRNEWELSDAQREIAIRFIREHPRDVLRMDGRKLRVLLFEVRESPGPVNGGDRMIVMLSNLADHLIFAVFVVLVVVDAWRGRLREYTGLAVLLGGAYLTPYFAGFLYQRHLVPLFGIVILALGVRLNESSRRNPAGELGTAADQTRRAAVS